MFEDIFEHTPWHLQEQRELALGEAREYLGHDVE
jgi:hypothetical protein